MVAVRNAMGAARGDADHAIAQNGRAVRHASHALDDQHQDRDQRDTEPVEQNHAVADPRRMVGIEGGDFVR